MLSASRVAEAPAKYANRNEELLDLALAIDKAIINNRPDGWRGVHAREQIVRGAIHAAFQAHGINADKDMVENIFRIIMQQKEY